MFRLFLPTVLLLSPLIEATVRDKAHQYNITTTEISDRLENAASGKNILEGVSFSNNSSYPKNEQNFKHKDFSLNIEQDDENSTLQMSKGVTGLVKEDIILPMLRSAWGQTWPKTKSGLKKGLVLIPYKYEKAFTLKYQRIIKKTLTWFSKHTCIRFVPQTRRGDHHLLFRNSKGCSAAVGRWNLYDSQPVNLEIPGCVNQGDILHELMHSLGFVHEQSRSDRDEYIKVLGRNLITSTSIKRAYPKQHTNNLVVYDYSSIMHYAEWTYAKRRYYRAFEVIPGGKNKAKVGKGNQLSPHDIENIKYLYKCDAGTYKRCGKDFINQKRGSFQSPNYPSTYPKESHCTWKITATRGRYVEIKFTNVNIEYSCFCQKDGIIVHDGVNAGKPVLRRICGNELQATITSSGRSMFVIFYSDGQQRKYTGFQASFLETPAPGIPPTPRELLPIETLPSYNHTINSFKCNFARGFCGLHQEQLDDMDWIRKKSSEDLIHWNGLNSPDYFIEPEAKNNRLGDSAILRTPWFKRYQAYYITFRYYMNEVYLDIGALRLFAYEQLTNKSSHEVIIFEKEENQGYKWHTAKVTFKPQRNVRFVHFYWKAYRDRKNCHVRLGDIGISTQGNTLPKGEVCTFEGSSTNINTTLPSPPKQNTLSFDLGSFKHMESVGNDSLCGWRQLSNGQDQFDWTRNKGQASTKGMGPRADHTIYKGHYMHIESSRPRKRNDAAVLETYTLIPTSYCIDIYYHMNGGNIGRLLLYAKQYDSNGKKTVKILSRIVGPQRGIWLHFQKHYSPQSKLNIQEVTFGLKGIVGRGERGDIAIDDVAVLPGNCDTCMTPTHRFINVSNQEKTFSTGCVNADIFWVRCCNSSKPKAIYRRVKECNTDMFTAARLDWFCSY